jgi:hypothetical protein
MSSVIHSGELILNISNINYSMKIQQSLKLLQGMPIGARIISLMKKATVN